MFSSDHVADLIEEFGLARGNCDLYDGGHARYPPRRDPESKWIIRPNYSPFAKKLPNNSAYFSLDLMRRFLPLFIALQIAALAGGAESTPPQPKIEGHVGRVSRSDIRQVIALAQRDMRHEFGRVIPIDRIQVEDHNHIMVWFSHEGHNIGVPIKRVHGVWTLPPPGVYVI
jgi:hypothetical protein